MVNIRPKTTVRMRMKAAATSHSRTDVEVRDVASTIDEPVERGGTNLGLSPTETMMAALLGCTNTITHKVAAANDVDIQAMDLRLEADFDRRGVLLQEEVDLPFPQVTLHIDITTDADDAKIDTVKRQLAMFCPVSKVIRQSGSTVDEVWTVHRPGEAAAD
ncbi:MAG: OsmC family protein [Pseudomonadota bacterium]